MAGLTISNKTTTYLEGSGKKVDESVSRVETKYIQATFDSSYPTGGETLDLTTYSRDQSTEPYAVFVSIYHSTAAEKAIQVTYDGENNKLVAYDLSAGGEVSNTTDLSGLVVLLKLEYVY